MILGMDADSWRDLAIFVATAALYLLGFPTSW
mgnify:CR=1 FL=1|jgi:hypothetical protein